MNGNEDLSLKDVTFLRAIRDINGSPERFASTEQGVTPATVTAITEATTLDEEEVAYRLDHPRLGRSGLVKVYEAGPPGHDSASLNSAELTKSGERAIADAEAGDAVDAGSQRPGEGQSEFDEMQQWEPAEVENGGNTAATESPPAVDGGTASVGAATKPRTERPTPPRTESPSGPPAESQPRADSTAEPQSAAESESTPTTEEEDDRLAALEARIERLEDERTTDSAAETAPTPGATTPDAASDEGRVDDLAEEVSALRETTDRLESTLDEALDELDAMKEAEYGALDEKREQQFETAVKSMVAFHQLASDVLDVRVENYEPSAGRADPERVEITRNRIADALGVGKSGGGDSGGIGLGGEEWPDPEEAAKGGRVFSGDDGGDADDADEPEPESDAPETGVYPPLGGDHDEDAGSPREAADESEDAEAEESEASDSGIYPPIGGGGDRDDGEGTEEADDTSEDGPGSDAPATGIYPPIGEDRDADTEGADADGSTTTDGDDGASGVLPESMRPDTEETGSITETAAEEGHVVDPIRHTDDGGATPRLDTDPEAARSVRRAITDDVDGADTWLLPDVDASTALAVRDAIASFDAADGEASVDGDGFPVGEAYARIAREGVSPESAADTATVPSPVDNGAEHAPADDDD
ncbi:hypothetical protein JCM30237_07930 [Halolamina litorea]|uniref:Helix-turn-helix domain-containing protein n=1 Tax=Halolamina litorea TaxID=1515593 RepID=A0ABD6BS04_9EURY|nr:hypothetical protein [Halolamina litorea]